MKRIKTILGITILSTLTLIGFTDKTDSNSQPSKSEEQSSIVNSSTNSELSYSSELSSNLSSNNEPSAQTTIIRSFEELCSHLENKGLVTASKKSEKNYSMFGAINGCGYDDECEIYEYEGDCPEKLTVMGVSFTYDARNKQYGLFISLLAC